MAEEVREILSANVATRLMIFLLSGRSVKIRPGVIKVLKCPQNFLLI